MWHLGGEQAEDPTQHARMLFRKQKDFNSFNNIEFCHGLHWRMHDLWKWSRLSETLKKLLLVCIILSIYHAVGSSQPRNALFPPAQKRSLLPSPRAVHVGMVSPWVPLLQWSAWREKFLQLRLHRGLSDAVCAQVGSDLNWTCWVTRGGT